MQAKSNVVPKKQARMMQRLLKDSLSSTSLRGNAGRDAAWDKMLGKAGIKRP